HCVSYRELVARAEALAGVLVRDHHVGPEDRVGLHATHSSAAVIGMLAVLKAGAAYVPIDAECPVERMKFIVADCDLRCVLAEQVVAERLEGHGVSVVLVDRLLA